MKCFVCGEDMRPTMVEPHVEAAMRGFAYRTFKCEGCGDTERRFAFDSQAAPGLPSTESDGSEVKIEPCKIGPCKIEP